MFIQTQDTPNPETVKFLPGRSVMEKGVAEFLTFDEAARSPLAQRIFGIDGVKSVFFGSDFISVTKEPEADWAFLKPRVLAAVMEHFTAGLSLFIHGSAPWEKDDSEDDDELTAQIKELLETRVRPAVAMDGGDIVFDRFEEGIVYLQMRGACSGCPSSTATLKMGIENMLKHYVPEVQEVRPVEG